MNESEIERLDTWGIVEVMGHKKFAGKIKEHVIGGASLIRVDVPAVENDPPQQRQPEFSKLIGVGSIYCITPTDERTARKAAAALAGYTEVLPVYIPPEPKQLPAHAGPSEDFDPGDDDDDDDEFNWGDDDDDDGGYGDDVDVPVSEAVANPDAEPKQ